MQPCGICSQAMTWTSAGIDVVGSMAADVGSCDASCEQTFVIAT